MKWISVDDDLPEHAGRYLGYTGEFITDFHFSSGEFWHDYIDDNLTHWMPLPKPPVKK